MFFLYLLLQCTIAHALEKTKYPESDIYWKKFEEKYHFSCQFTADLFAMNHTDFIITSTFQEIAGRCDMISFFAIFVSLIIWLTEFVVFSCAARILLDSMRVTLPSLFRDSTVSCTVSMSLILSSTLYLLELIRPFTSLTPKLAAG